MSDYPAFEPEVNEDERLLRALGYRQELARRMSGFSNFAISFSIICILAGGITSFHVGLCSAGGASVGLGWPLVCLFSLSVALTMAQIASAFPTAGGLYHWASILGGRGLGWLTAWFNLAGLVAVLGAVNAGAFDFANSVFGFANGPDAAIIKVITVSAMTLSQGLLNHYGIRLTTLLTDLSGYLILVVTLVLTAGLLFATKHFEWARLWTFTNFSGLPPEAPVVPAQNNLIWLFALGFLLPAYTVTGFDASAHISEETLSAAHNVPRGIVRSVWVSGLFGWLLTATILLAIPDLREGANKGADVVAWTVRSVLPSKLAALLLSCTVLAQYLCALAALTSASRMIFAFARDGGLPLSRYLGKVSSVTRAPTHAIWCTAVVAVFLTAVVPYTTIAAVCTVFLYISYILPVLAGFFSYGRTWTKMGPWELGVWYRPLAIFATVGCGFLIVIGLQPPNQQAVPILVGALILLLVFWFGYERKNFKGPPQVMIAKAKEG
jgi:amino acid transporter